MLGPKLPSSTLNGGWQYTTEIYDKVLSHPNVTIISRSEPRVILIKDFLTESEVEHLIALAESGFERSEVVSETNSVSNHRTSYGSWLNGPQKRTDTVLDIQHKIAELTGIPEEFGESLYVLRYRQDEKYESHTDHCHHSADETLSSACEGFLKRAGGPKCGESAGGASCGDRIATVVIYLKTPSGTGIEGSTVFPRAKSNNNSSSQEEEGNGDDTTTPWYCKNNAQVLKAKPKSGEALLFYNYIPGKDGELAVADPTSAHAGCPPGPGSMKIIATRWIRSATFS